MLSPTANLGFFLQTCENFLALCGTDYYNNCMFTRNIKVHFGESGFVLPNNISPGFHGSDRRPNKYRKGRREHLGREISGLLQY